MNSTNTIPHSKPEIAPPLPDTIPLPENDPSQKPLYTPVPDEIEPVNPESPNKTPDLPEMDPSSEPPDTLPSSPHPTNPIDPIDSA